MSSSPAGPAALPDLLFADDRRQRERVRRMKLAATSALLVAAVVYVVTTAFFDGEGVSGFVSAGAEAAMVGGLADWFAVTALFRHPLGIPIPHTALIPRKKDELATKLGEFVTTHFLTADIVSAHLAEARVVSRLGAALSDPATARHVSDRVSTALADALGAVPARSLTAYALDVARRDLAARSYAPLLGRMLRTALTARTHEPLVDVLVRHARAYLRDNREVVEHHLAHLAREHGFLSRLFVSEKRIRRLVDDVAAQLEAAETDPQHWLHQGVERILVAVADDLENERATARTVDEALARLVDEPGVHERLSGFVEELLTSMRAGLLDPAGTLRERLAAVLREVADRAENDRGFQQAREDELRRVVVYAVTNYGDVVVALIQRTVASWEARDASTRIETAVGRDLQFIRINGTIVGGLAGLVIHAVSTVA
jgi:uncharacterized membrane-anchored protein YjiN (DUF445 family)